MELETYPNNDVVLCWSGGRDSTLILRNLLAEKKTVTTYSLSHPQVMASKIQKSCRRILKAKLEKQYGKFKSVEFNSTQDINTYGEFGQAILWLTSAQLYLSNKQDLYLGYIRGDDVWHRITYIKNIFQNLQTLSAKTGELRFPFEWADKVGIIKELKTSTDLLDSTYFCQDGNLQPCGKCASCITNECAMISIKKEEIASKQSKLKVKSK